MRDPRTFLGQFVYTYDPHSSPPIRLFPQKAYLGFLTDMWLKEPFLLIAKSRQMQATWLFVALYVWDCIAHPGRYVFFQSKKEDDAGSLKIPLSLLSRAKFILDNLPEIFRPQYQYIVSQNPCIINFANGSTIHAVSQNSDAVRQYTATGILSDEMAFQENAKEALQAVIPTLVGGGRFTGVSSANGKNFFYRLYVDME